jgi:hypothetical protein
MRINEFGYKEIHNFLCANHKRPEAQNLHAWAAKAEFQLGEGNPPSIEIKAWESVHGRTQEYTISDAGIDDGGEQ